MLIHTDPTIVAKTPHTVLMVGAPVRLDWLYNAVLKRGVYYIEGDLRNKVVTRIGQRQMQAGLVKLEYIGSAPSQPIVVQVPVPASEPAQEGLTPAFEMSEDEVVVLEDHQAAEVPEAVEPAPVAKKRGRKAKPVAEVAAAPTLPVYDENSSNPVQEDGGTDENR